MKKRYVTYGQGKYDLKIYVISMQRIAFRNWEVKVEPCDIYGDAVSDAIVWDSFGSWIAARRYFKCQYKEFDKYVNDGR